MSEFGNKAVFLSYASQDAAAVARLAEALRAAGVEVWFDRNELVGGDAWDAKIRQQIRECALFVPVISASTQARAEGYFRREWKLAVERTHDMADHVTFLLPVVIDGTGDAEAFVPEKFREVQWTHLRQGFGEHARPEVLAGFGARVAGILRGEPAGRRPELPPRGAAPRNDATVPRGGSRRGGRLALAGAIAAVAVAAWGLWPRREVGRPDVSSGPAPIAGYAAPLAPAAVPSEAQRLTQQVMALLDDEPMQLRENFFLADELGQRAVKADPTDGEAWAVAGRASVLLARRRFDASATRRELARMQVGRAQSLAPDSLETAYASALLQGLVGDREAEEKLLRELTVRAPGDWRFWLELGNRRRRGDQFDEALRLLRKAAALAPGNSRILADEGGTLVQQFRLAEAEATYARALAGNPGRGAYFRRFALLSIYVYDVPAAKAFLEQIPARLRQEDAVISTAAEFFLRTGDGDRALTELRRLPRDFFEDGWDWRPRGYLAGHAHRIAGRATAAQAEWKQALAAVEKRLAAEQNEHLLLYWRSVLLALTGQIEAARASHKLLRELEPLNDGNTWFDAILLAAMGERETAIATLLDLWPRADFALRNDLWGDVLHAPWFAALRDDPRLRARRRRPRNRWRCWRSTTAATTRTRSISPRASARS
jgi:tetratricopeptide (TPR) repeat protein